MKKAIIICCLIFVFFGVLFVVFFGNTTVKKKSHVSTKVYQYEESPFYKNVLANNKTIYLNILSSDSPYSIERYEELMKDSTKIVYNIFTDNDSLVIKSAIEKFGIKNDITLENYYYQEEILKNIYFDRNISFGGFIEISDYSTPKTFIFDKQKLKDSF
jgi:flagellar basal body-associated protein FliL